MKLLDMMKEAHKGRAPNSVEYFRELKQMTQKEQDNVMRDYEEWKTTYDKENNLKALGRKRSGK
jgi:esterase/lipase